MDHTFIVPQKSETLVNDKIIWPVVAEKLKNVAMLTLVIQIRRGKVAFARRVR